ncbi:unnamed protein product [Brachionus calyciflorus]|uniref:RGS domain-containing protein n=1 Tax=Brachionus calyciflorus TaxID=104777 RepID=A0A814AHZ1_9BILA|nr:unnamed protein product [Brachionus calyciflorus]
MPLFRGKCCTRLKLETPVGLSIDLILNEISRLYRNQDYVFTSSSNLASHTNQMPLMTNNNQNLSPVLYNNYSNHNYELVTEEQPVLADQHDKSPYMILNKNTNDIYFNKENFLKEDLAQIPKDVSSLSNLEDNNFDSINTSNGSKSSRTKKTKIYQTKETLIQQQTQPQTVQSIKTIKENFANLFLSKKTQLNDSDVLKTIEIETNRCKKVEDNGKIKVSRTSQAFQFLKSKPPISSNHKTKVNQQEFQDENVDFFDANHVLNTIETNQCSNSSNTNTMTRMSYPINNGQNDKNTKSTSTAKRLLFNLIIGNVNTIKDNNQKGNQFQTRRLSDYHRPTKSLNTNDTENIGDKLNSTKISLTNSLIDVNEDIINEKSNEIGRVTKWATGFEKLLEDPLGLEIFTEFLKKEYSEENIDFWVKCENFKKLTDMDEMKQVANEIWNTYLDTSSMCQINVDNKARSSCQEALQTPNLSMFEMAQTQIFSLMKYDSYSRFLKSQMYKDCIVNEMEGKPIRKISNKNDANLANGKNKEAQMSLSNTNLNNNVNSSHSPKSNSNSSSNTNLSNDPIRKEKKRILPWNKVKKSLHSSQTPTITPGFSATLSKGLAQKTHLFQSLDTNKGASQPNLNQLTPSSNSPLVNQLESKFCRVLCNNDGSSTMVQPVPGQTVYQTLSKIFHKKNIPWYKCDLYFVGDYKAVDQNMDSHVLCSKEICLVERSLFVLSLIPIAINLCVKANMKRTLGSVLQPILDYYQIKTLNCGIFLNPGNLSVNLNDSCSSIDGQHILVVHKQQSNFFSQNEIDKLIKVSINDFLPNNFNDYQLHFDELGILKQVKKNNSVTSNLNSPVIPSTPQIQTKTNSSISSLNINPINQNIKNRKLNNEDLGEKNFMDLLKRAQNHSLEDQRGRIDSKHLQIPEFLLSSSNLIKSQSMTQNLGHLSFQLNTLNSNYQNSDNYYEHQANNNNNSFDYNLMHQTNNLVGMQGINKSSVSLPVESNYITYPIKYHTMHQTTTTNTISRSRSPVVIVYDNEDYQNIDYVYENRFETSDKLNDTPMNYESISENNSPIKSIHQSNTSIVQNNSRISYV